LEHAFQMLRIIEEISSSFSLSWLTSFLSQIDVGLNLLIDFFNWSINLWLELLGIDSQSWKL
jgi:hypothetical protein